MNNETTTHTTATGGQMPKILTVKEAAEQVRLRPSTIYHYVITKQIPFYKLGNKVFIEQKQLIAWFEGKRCKTDAELSEIVQQTSSKRAVRTK